MLAFRILAGVAGLVVVYLTLGASVRTVILPRGIPSRLARVVFLTVRGVFQLRAGPSASYERQDRVMALYGPMSLLVLLGTWVTLVLAGYTAMFWALEDGSWREAFFNSGSSVLTLGFAHPGDLPGVTLAFTEAGIGLTLLAMLITYLPSIYQAFSRREAAVTALEVRAGTPPTAVEMIERFWILGRVDKLGEVWTRWEEWFVDIEESHTSFPALVFFRSPQPDHSWVTAAGAVLDGASLVVSTVDIPRDVQGEICIRAGYIALRRVADFFGIPYEPDPGRGDPISISREEYDQVVERLASTGVPIKPDRDEAWLDFAGWRVNYDAVLLALAALTIAPYARGPRTVRSERCRPVRSGSSAAAGRRRVIGAGPHRPGPSAAGLRSPT
jgi:hypothetical protein